MHDHTPTPAPHPAGQTLLPDSVFAFTTVPHARNRADGWTPPVQAAFIQALSVMGSVGQAARAVGMGRASAYRLRERAGGRTELCRCVGRGNLGGALGSICGGDGAGD